MDGGRQGWGLEGHGVIVTGAAQGIGEATARAFADVGARVCAVDLREEQLRTLVETLPGGPHQAARWVPIPQLVVILWVMPSRRRPERVGQTFQSDAGTLS